MSLQPDELVDPTQAFWDTDPTILHEPDPFATQPTQVADHPDLKKIAIAIAAAIVVLRIVMKARLAEGNAPQSPEEIRERAQKVYKQIIPGWMQASVPAITQAYRLGATGNMTYAELENMASSYAAELGQYVNDTSIDALVEGFAAQVNGGWSERLAWERSREAYGLDSQQMRSYVKGLLVRDKTEYVTDPVPATARSAIDRAFMMRADRMGSNEAYKATQVGKNMVWLAMQAGGQIPEGTLKMWITAEDERVCPVCAPLDQTVIPLHHRFESNGQFFYAPGVHPNCRCELQMVPPQFEDIVKNMPGDPYDRDAAGKFAVAEERKAKPVATSAADMFTKTEEKARSAADAFRMSATDVFSEAMKESKALEAKFATSAADMFSSAADAFGVPDKATKRVYRINVFSQADGKPEVKPIGAPWNPRNHDTEASFPADTMIDLLSKQGKNRHLWSRSYLLNKNNIGKAVDFGTEGHHGAHVVVAQTGLSGMDNSMAIAMHDAEQRQKANIHVYGASNEVSDFNRYGKSLPRDLQGARRALAGMKTEDLVMEVIMPALQDDPTIGDGFPEPYRGMDLEDENPNVVAQIILDRLVTETESDRRGIRGTGAMTKQVKAVMDQVKAETSTVDQILAQRDAIGGDINPIIFKFRNWHGEQRAVNVADVTGKYRIVAISSKQTGQASGLVPKVHIVELERWSD